ncbi:uncharacterized protein [Euphorbia lathyris]|uniref:uncharacterized protein isoform X2 n=1 Tax=Euphorbia lathyris TaxID=212925 RepID=UPI0033131ED3
MAAPQSKSISSSSPSPSKPTTPRYSEISNPMRRSFTGNPFAKKQPSIVPNPRSGFNPNTPANSPSDYPLRNSIDSENKENSKDVNVKSPPPSKGTKHFMSPTISAASKINATPRKKMLTERSESVHTSVNRHEALNEDSDFKPEKGLNKKKEVSFNPTVTYLKDKEEEIMTSYEDLDSVVADGCDLFSETAPAVDDFVNLDPSFRISPMASNSPLPSPSLAPLAEDLDSVGDGWGSFSEAAAAVDDSVNLDPSFRVSPMAFSSSLSSPALAPLDADPLMSLSSPALAPLDADPLMLPYDPKTNYLAPRPQFRRYKPNPRLELYLKQRYGERLEESFVSESSSDSEFSEQESDESDMDSQKDSEDVASGDVVPEEEEKEEESEPNSIATFEGAIEVRKVSKRHLLTRPKFTALLFVLALAGLWASVSNSPIMDPSVLNNLNFPNLYVPPEISQFTRENLEGLAQKFRQWLYESLSSIHNLVSSFTEGHKPGRLQFANTTILLEECSIDNYLMGEHSNFLAEFMHKEKEKDATPIEAHEKDEGGPEIEDEERVECDELIEEDVEGGYNTAADESSEEVSDDKGQGSEYQEAIVVPYSVVEASGIAIVPESDEESMLTTTTDEANAYSILAAEVTQARVEIAELFGLPSNADVAEEWVAIPNAEPDVANPQQPVAEFVVSPVETESTMPDFETESSDSDAPTMETQRTGSVDMAVDRIKNLFLGQAVLGTISLTVSSLLAVIAFIYMKNLISMAPPNAAAVDQVPRAKKADHSPLSMSTRNTFEESCCPSEMSSSRYSSSYSKEEQRGSSEAQSQGRRSRSNTRRESMASSDYSMGSSSYGSFTTYQKVQIKHGNAEEEFLTPVRRSTRIRKQVTSP